MNKGFLVRWLPWIFLGVVLVVALAIGAQGGAEPTITERTRSVAETLRCPQCTDKSMAASDAPTSVASRNEITRQLVAGQTPDQIRAWFATRYGQDILLTPSRDGVEGLIWALPVAAFVIASAALAFAFARWKRHIDDAPSPDDELLVEQARSGTDP